MERKQPAPAVVVTGAAGFIGSHLVERYLRDGWRVLGLDSLLTGDARNLNEAAADPAFTFVKMDVTGDWDAVARIVEDGGTPPSLILHFASPASPVDYARLPLQTMAVNSLGTQRCLENARAWSSRLLYASTSETYGDPLEHPQRESYWGNVNPVGPRSCYDEAKRFGEALVMAYSREHNTDVRIVRIFNTYGPRMRFDDGRVVPNFILQALRGEDLTIYGDGRQTRSFCYVDDLIEGIVRCAASIDTQRLVVNLGNPEEFTIREFAQLVCEVAGVKATFRERPLPQDDPARRCPDISRAQKLLAGWEPQISLREGLAKTLRDFEMRLASRHAGAA